MTGLTVPRSGQGQPEGGPTPSLPCTAAGARAQHRRRLGQRPIVALPILVGAAGLLAWACWYVMFTALEYFDDEGDWLIELEEFYKHGRLYHLVWSQGGPFYYDFWAAIFGLAHLSFTIDAGRLAGLATWTAVALAAGLLTWGLARRLGPALIALVGVGLAMEGLCGEPLEPAGLASLLIVLALATGALARRRYPRAAMALMGALAAAALFSKVNLGLFLVAGVVAAAVLSARRWRAAVAPYWVALGIFGVVPVGLCLSLIRQAKVVNLILLVIMGGTAIVVTAARTSRDEHDWPVGGSELAWGAAGALGMAVLVTVTGVATGTSIGQLVNGSLLAQRDLAHLYSAPAPWLAGDLPIAAASVAGAVAVNLPSVRPYLTLTIRVAGRAVVGTFMVLTCIGGLLTTPTFNNLTHFAVVADLVRGRSFYAGPLTWGTCLYAISLAWLVTRKPGPDGASRFSFPRALLASVAVLLSLECYPVAGHQLSWSTIGLVIVGAVIVSDAVALAGLGSAPRRLRTWGGPLTTVVCLGLTLFNLFGFTANYVILYHRNIPTGFASAKLERWPRRIVDAYQTAVKDLKAHCSTFYGLPGLNSFYFYTGMAPPSTLDTTQWMYLMSDADQQKVVAALERTPDLCVLYNPPALFFWEQGKHLPTTSPLLDYMEENFAPITVVGTLVVLARTNAGKAPAVHVKEFAPRWRTPVHAFGPPVAPYFT